MLQKPLPLEEYFNFLLSNGLFNFKIAMIQKIGVLLDEDRVEEAISLQKKVEQKLALSDRIVNGDLLRFNTPENFTPVDRSQYNYSKYDNGMKEVVK
ncbi:hypothetical protein BTR23_25640 [Alkalihalophilus pseudofirmus]|nr:hypothetical protein BTR23_25640 [Alkalihalophilus pseudofirmus]